MVWFQLRRKIRTRISEIFCIVHVTIWIQSGGLALWSKSPFFALPKIDFFLWSRLVFMVFFVYKIISASNPFLLPFLHWIFHCGRYCSEICTKKTFRRKLDTFIIYLPTYFFYYTQSLCLIKRHVEWVVYRQQKRRTLQDTHHQPTTTQVFWTRLGMMGGGLDLFLYV